MAQQNAWQQLVFCLFTFLDLRFVKFSLGEILLAQHNFRMKCRLLSGSDHKSSGMPVKN